MNQRLKLHHNVQIPVEVLLNEDLDCYTKVVFAYMKLRYQFFNRISKDYCESNTTIADSIGVSRSKVIRSINTLIECGFVERVTRNNKGVTRSSQTNIYKVKDCLTVEKGLKVGLDTEDDGVPF